MEIESFSCMRSSPKGDIEPFSCIRNKNSLDQFSYISSSPDNNIYSLPSVPVCPSNPSTPPVSSPSHIRTSKMVVDLQSQNPCVVTADPSVQSSPHDYKLAPQEVSPRTASQDYKLLQQEVSPKSASHDFKHLTPEMTSPSSAAHKNHQQDISPRMRQDFTKVQQDQVFSPKAPHDYEISNQTHSPRTASHDYRLLPPEGVLTPSPDNPPNIDNPDVPHERTFAGGHTPGSSPPHLSPKRLDMDPRGVNFETRMDLDSFDQNSGSEQSPSQTPEKIRSRRKQTIEDIVRRMRMPPMENGYYSNESDDEDDDEEGMESMNGMLSMDMHDNERRQDEGRCRTGCGHDEVDGAPPMPTSGICDTNLHTSVNPSLGSNGKDCSENGLDRMPFKTGSISYDNENIQPDGQNMNQENGHIHEQNQENKEDKAMSPERMQINAIMDKVAEITGGGKSSQDFPNTPKMNGSNWYHGTFNSLPLFPFTPSPLEPHLNPNFLPLFDGKFPSSQEVEKDYLKCQYCERTFRRQKNLENHVENTHHGKGPTRRKSTDGSQTDMYFKCTHCPYTTKHQSNLYVHLRIHTGERPYICGACGVQYSQSHSLKSHIINKHDGIMSYYIKEKRNRSPRGLGYLTHVVPDMYKINASSMIPPNMTPNHHQHPQQGSLLMPQSNLPIPPHPQVMTSLHQGVMTSPHHGQNQQPMTSPMQKMMMSPQQQMAGHPQQENRGPAHMNNHQPENLSQSARTPHAQQSNNHQVQQKSSPTFYANGHPSPNFSNYIFQCMKPPHSMPDEQPLPLVTSQQHSPPKSQQSMPLQEIRINQPNEGDVNHGAIDLTKKTSPPTQREQAIEALKVLEMNGFEIPNGHMDKHDKDLKCLERGASECVNCVHAMKLRTLRLNVVRMLSILVPNLNFEEKGISAEGDSVDELLHDVIESNMQEEEMSD